MQRVLVCLSKPSSLIEYKQICPFLLNAQWILCTNLFAGSLDRWFAYFSVSRSTTNSNVIAWRFIWFRRDSKFHIWFISNVMSTFFDISFGSCVVLIHVEARDRIFMFALCVFFGVVAFFVLWIFFLHLNTLFSYMHEWSDCYN